MHGAPKGFKTTSYPLDTTLGGQRGHPSQVGGPIHMKFEPSHTLGRPYTKMADQDAYKLSFL